MCGVIGLPLLPLLLPLSSCWLFLRFLTLRVTCGKWEGGSEVGSVGFEIRSRLVGAAQCDA